MSSLALELMMDKLFCNSPAVMPLIFLNIIENEREIYLFLLEFAGRTGSSLHRIGFFKSAPFDLKRLGT
jgi:hypothetical protein